MADPSRQQTQRQLVQLGDPAPNREVRTSEAVAARHYDGCPRAKLHGAPDGSPTETGIADAAAAHAVGRCGKVATTVRL